MLPEGCQVTSEMEMCEMCARQRARELLQASWWRVEVPPPRCACHVAQASGGWLPRIDKRKMKVDALALGPVRSDVSQHCPFSR